MPEVVRLVRVVHQGEQAHRGDYSLPSRLSRSLLASSRLSRSVVDLIASSRSSRSLIASRLLSAPCRDFPSRRGPRSRRGLRSRCCPLVREDQRDLQCLVGDLNSDNLRRMACFYKFDPAWMDYSLAKKNKKKAKAEAPAHLIEGQSPPRRLLQGCRTVRVSRTCRV